MYQQDSSAMDTTTLRIFSPIILFHDATACSDNQVIQLKKQKVNAMLKSNGQFWSNVIQSTRNSAFSSPPQTPPPTLFTSCNSSVASSCDEPRQKWYGTPSDDTDMEDEVDVEDDDEPVPTSNSNIITVKKRVKSTNGRKRRGNLPKSVTAILKQWLIDHCRHPYPTEEEKRSLRLKTNLTLNQISNWFINARRRILPLILSSPNNSKSNTTTNTNGLNEKEKKTRRKRGWMSEQTTGK
ncbi:hypothetical protein HPULCUR_011401 [Helicostylum pulchrum]|uniref:Homeobox domain-containing protein n=1 Tax=Helicostylum pulchrum TaxID=562976 RepID=A0ABP9YFZ2_9FUNG